MGSITNAVLSTALVFASLSALATCSLPLIPQPHTCFERGRYVLSKGINISAPGGERDDRFAALDLAATFKQRGILPSRSAAAPNIVLLRRSSSRGIRLLQLEKIEFSPAMHEEGYVIVASGNSLYIIGETSAGVFYGAQTAKQLVSANGKDSVLHTAKITDWPAMKYRGLHDDLSRGPVPTLAFQKKQLLTLAAFKANVYSPYFEHTFAYRKNPLPALPGGSMTPEDGKELVEYAAQLHIMIIPEQEAFGHLHHVLINEQYGALAETPQGAVLAPGETGTLPLIRQWFSELAEVFPSPMMHIGADETFDLGKGKSGEEVKSRGLGAVYLGFLKQIHATLAPLHKQLLFWGDVAVNEPALVSSLPKDMIAVAWVYEPEAEGYQHWIKPFTDAGIQTWVAPGVSNWKRVYPNNDTALRNIQGLVAEGQRMGATGMLNTVWNDDGEGLFLQDWYGALFGAAAAWQSGSSNIDQFQRAYGPVFHGEMQGSVNEAQRELIAAHLTLAGAGLGDGKNALFWLDPWSEEGQQTTVKLLPVAHELRMHAERALTLIAAAREQSALQERDALDAMDMGARRLDFIGLKFQIADEISTMYRALYANRADPQTQHTIGNQLWIISGVNGRCQDLRDGYNYTKDEFRDLWLRENRPYALGNVLTRYELATQLWITRGDRFQAASQQWHSKNTLPTPEELGLPAATQQ